MKRLQVVVFMVALSIFCYLVFAAEKIKKEEPDATNTSSTFSGELTADLLPTSQNLQLRDNFVVFSTGKGQFHLTYQNSAQSEVSIQIYDIIGNLLLEEELGHSSINRNYNLSESGSRLFVVRLDNQKTALIRKVSAG